MSQTSGTNEQSVQPAAPANMNDIQAKLRRLERREWWRWAVALLVMALLTVGVLSLTISVGRREAFEEYQLKLAARGLLGIVLLFDVFAVYQQILITRLRRDLATQIGMIATLEALKPPVSVGPKDRRELARCYIDQLLKVKKNGSHAYGRATEISENGIGAVLPELLEPGETVGLEFSLGFKGPKLSVSAIVRHRQGFRHGLEFVGLAASELEAVRQACNELAAV
ncbi:MAG: PilZ domain-containing protein [Terriglobales bacterium]